MPAGMVSIINSLVLSSTNSDVDISFSAASEALYFKCSNVCADLYRMDCLSAQSVSGLVMSDSLLGGICAFAVSTDVLRFPPLPERLPLGMVSVFGDFVPDAMAGTDNFSSTVDVSALGIARLVAGYMPAFIRCNGNSGFST